MERVVEGKARGSWRWAQAYARLALGAAFLSAVASRLGLWQLRLDAQRFDQFVAYTREVNSFLPATWAPALAVAATIAESSLGLCLLAGVWRRPVAAASAGLLAVFGTAMALSYGPQEPLDYSVFSASAAALLLALAPQQATTEEGNATS